MGAIPDIENVQAFVPGEHEGVAVAHEGIVNAVVVRYRRAAGSRDGPRSRLGEIKNHQRAVGRILGRKRVEFSADVCQRTGVEPSRYDLLGARNSPAYLDW